MPQFQDQATQIRPACWSDCVCRHRNTNAASRVWRIAKPTPTSNFKNISPFHTSWQQLWEWLWKEVLSGKYHNAFGSPLPWCRMKPSWGDTFLLWTEARLSVHPLLYSPVHLTPPHTSFPWSSSFLCLSHPLLPNYFNKLHTPLSLTLAAW